MSEKVAPRLVTREALAATAADRWAVAPPRENNRYGNDRDAIREALYALGPNPNPDDVDRTIGNDSWTRPLMCSQCGDDAVFGVGEFSWHETLTAYLCRGCIRGLAAALDALEAQEARCDAATPRVALVTQDDGVAFGAVRLAGVPLDVLAGPVLVSGADPEQEVAAYGIEEPAASLVVDMLRVLGRLARRGRRKVRLPR